MIKVLFVCHGNICRSPMAENVFKFMLRKKGIADKVRVDSAATSREEIGSDIHNGTKDVLDKNGIIYLKRSARQIRRSDYDNFDYIIGMDTANVKNMLLAFGTDTEKKIKRLLDYTDTPRDVADPWYTHNFDDAYADVWAGCEKLLEYILENNTFEEENG